MGLHEDPEKVLDDADRPGDVAAWGSAAIRTGQRHCAIHLYALLRFGEIDCEFWAFLPFITTVLRH